MIGRVLLAASLAAAFAGPQFCAATELDIPAAHYPGLPGTAADLAGFVPAGWVLEAQAEGDLNRDGTGDVVFVLREENPANVLEGANGPGSESLNTNPRILGVAFRAGDGAEYRLALSNHTLIPRREDPVLDEPFYPSGLRLERGAFSVTLHFFTAAGGWESGQTKLTFRHQNDRFELIGLDRIWIHRGTGETTEVSMNLSTGRVSTTIGNIEEDEPESVEWTSLPAGKVFTIDQITDAFRFDPREP